MAEHRNVQLVREGYHAFLAADMEWLNEHLHENVVWHVPGNNALSGDYRGREAALAFFARSLKVVLPEFDIHDVVGNDDHVVALLNLKWKRNDNGQVFEGRAVQTFHVDAQGRALEVWTMSEDQSAVDRFLEGVQT
jgi:ketosteroid isomerase-like protein